MIPEAIPIFFSTCRSIGGDSQQRFGQRSPSAGVVSESRSEGKIINRRTIVPTALEKTGMVYQRGRLF